MPGFDGTGPRGGGPLTGGGQGKCTGTPGKKRATGILGAGRGEGGASTSAEVRVGVMARRLSQRPQEEGETMRLAITSLGPSLNDSVDEHFGRARYILIVDTEEGLLESIDNQQNLNAVQGAGINASQTVADHGVRWVLTGHAGPKAFAALQSAGINVGMVTSGLCREALERFKDGGFEAIKEADVESHWG